MAVMGTTSGVTIGMWKQGEGVLVDISGAAVSLTRDEVLELAHSLFEKLGLRVTGLEQTQD